jgi:hypothetical protein
MSVSKFNPTTGTFDQAAYDPDSGGWNDPTSMTLSPGEAAFLDNKSGARLNWYSKARAGPSSSRAGAWFALLEPAGAGARNL